MPFEEMSVGADLFETAKQADALVNTVNCKGVMGAGVAWKASQLFPEMLLPYRAACGIKPEWYEGKRFKVQGALTEEYKRIWEEREKLFIVRANGDWFGYPQLEPGGLFIWQNESGGPNYVVNFASKDTWQANSRIEWIVDGFKNMRKWAEEYGVKTIACPPPGAGHGGLNLEDVERIGRKIFQHSDVTLLFHGRFREREPRIFSALSAPTPLSRSMAALIVPGEPAPPQPFTRAIGGIGSSKTPEDAGQEQTAVVKKFADHGFWMISGGAFGSDTFSERGADPKRKLIIFGNLRHKYGPAGYVPIPPLDEQHVLLQPGPLKDLAFKAMASVMPKDHWANIVRKGDFVSNLWTRNSFQVLGADLKSPVEMLICWGEPDFDGTVKGGTKGAIKLADRLGIPWFNLAVPEHRAKLQAYMDAGFPPRSRESLEKTYEAMAELGVISREEIAERLGVSRDAQRTAAEPATGGAEAPDVPAKPLAASEKFVWTKPPYREFKDTFLRAEDFIERTVEGVQVLEAPGVVVLRGLLKSEDLAVLRAQETEIVDELGLETPEMPKTGTPYRYRMACAGPVKWTSDMTSMRYEANLDTDGRPVHMPQAIKDACDLALALGGVKDAPQMQTALINRYETTSAKLGMHRDKDEVSDKPFVSISHGAACDFEIAGYTLKLNEGDVIVIHGPQRFARHAVTAVHGAPRTNITARQVENRQLQIEYRGEHLPSYERLIAAVQSSGKSEVLEAKEPVALRVVNVSHLERGESDFTIYCGRSDWPVEKLGLDRVKALGNHHNVSKYGGQRGPAIADFAKDYAAWLAERKPEYIAGTKKLVEFAKANGKLNMGCHCAPDNCHCDVIMSVVAKTLRHYGYEVPLSAEQEAKVDKYAWVFDAMRTRQVVEPQPEVSLAR